MKHKTLLVYVPCLDGGCEDVGRIELDGHTLISDERLWDLEAAEADALEQARLNGMGGEREAALLAKLEAAEKDIAVKEEVIDSLAAVVKRLDAQCDAAEKSDAESIAMYRKARDERDALRADLEKERKEHGYTLHAAEAEAKQVDRLRAKIDRMEKRLRLILEEPENTMSNSKAMREMLRQARLALEESK